MGAILFGFQHPAKVFSNVDSHGWEYEKARSGIMIDAGVAQW